MRGPYRTPATPPVPEDPRWPEGWWAFILDVPEPVWRRWIDTPVTPFPLTPEGHARAVAIMEAFDDR